MRRGGGVRGRRGVITLLKAHYQCDIGYHGSTGYHGSAGYHGNREVAPVLHLAGRLYIVTFIIIQKDCSA